MAIEIIRTMTAPYRYGVLKTSSDNPAGKIIVPVNYNFINLQANGIVAKNPDNTEDGFLYDGTPVLKNSTNILFLQENFALASDPKTQKLYLFTPHTTKLICPYGFESILIFRDTNHQATEFNSSTNMSTFTAKTKAFVENLICIKYDGLWGVFNIAKQQMHSEFEHKVIVQCRGGNIGVRGQDNSVQML